MKKRIFQFMMLTVLFASALGITSFALVQKGPLKGDFTYPTAYAIITNNKTTNRYCKVTLFQTNAGNQSNLETLSSNDKNTDAGYFVYTSGNPSKEHVYARGWIYKGTTQNSGSEVSYTLQIK